ncbi:MAG: hypothetical protein ABSE40_23765 [Candidatus Sulfotelmatobacter sp.]|jgi:hypothetical protein
MLTDMVSIRSPLTVHQSSNRSNVSMESARFVLEQNAEFAKWWKQWRRQLRQNRANTSKPTLTYGEQNRASCRRWLIWLVNAIAACRIFLSTVVPVIRSAFNF